MPGDLICDGPFLLTARGSLVMLSDTRPPADRRPAELVPVPGLTNGDAGWPAVTVQGAVPKFRVVRELRRDPSWEHPDSDHFRVSVFVRLARSAGTKYRKISVKTWTDHAGEPGKKFRECLYAGVGLYVYSPGDERVRADRDGGWDGTGSGIAASGLPAAPFVLETAALYPLFPSLTFDVSVNVFTEMEGTGTGSGGSYLTDEEYEACLGHLYGVEVTLSE